MSTPGGIPVVDTHQHLWDLAEQRVPWLPGSGPLARSFTMADYREATRGLPVKAVYMEVDVAPEDKAAEAERVIRHCEDAATPTKGAVIGGRVADPGFAAYLDRFKGVRWIKGVRQVLHGETIITALSDDADCLVEKLRAPDLGIIAFTRARHGRSLY